MLLWKEIWKIYLIILFFLLLFLQKCILFWIDRTKLNNLSINRDDIRKAIESDEKLKEMIKGNQE